jgi:hypothetical protein
VTKKKGCRRYKSLCTKICSTCNLKLLRAAAQPRSHDRTVGKLLPLDPARTVPANRELYDPFISYLLHHDSNLKNIARTLMIRRGFVILVAAQLLHLSDLQILDSLPICADYLASFGFGQPSAQRRRFHQCLPLRFKMMQTWSNRQRSVRLKKLLQCRVHLSS